MITHRFRTILGDIPPDWETISLKEALEHHKSGDWGEDRGEIESRVLRSTNFTMEGDIDFSDVALRYFPAKSAGNFEIKKGDLLLERSGGGPTQPVGRIVFVRDDLIGYGFSNFVQLLRIDKDKINPEYLGWLLFELNRSGIVERLQHQTTQMRNLEYRDFIRVQLPKPPPHEQEQIVTLINAVNEAIMRTKEELAATRRLKTAFVRHAIMDFEEYSGKKPLKMSSLPSGWKIFKMNRLVLFRQLGTNEVAEPDENYLPLIKMGDLDFGSIDLSKVEYVSKYKESLLNDYKLQDGDFLFNTRNTPELVGKSCVWHSEIPKAIFNNNIMRIRFYPKLVLPDYMNFEFSSWRGRRRLKALATGTTSVAAIYWGDLSRVEIPLPPVEYQAEQITTYSQVINHQNSINQVLDSLQTLKKSLLQNLLTGKVRVNVGAPA